MVKHNMFMVLVKNHTFMSDKMSDPHTSIQLRCRSATHLCGGTFLSGLLPWAGPERTITSTLRFHWIGFACENSFLMRSRLSLVSYKITRKWIMLWSNIEKESSCGNMWILCRKDPPFFFFGEMRYDTQLEMRYDTQLDTGWSWFSFRFFHFKLT